jgi:hypothetical protein
MFGTTFDVKLGGICGCLVKTCGYLRENLRKIMRKTPEIPFSSFPKLKTNTPLEIHTELPSMNMKLIHQIIGSKHSQ